MVGTLPDDIPIENVTVLKNLNEYRMTVEGCEMVRLIVAYCRNVGVWIDFTLHDLRSYCSDGVKNKDPVVEALVARDWLEKGESLVDYLHWHQLIEKEENNGEKRYKIKPKLIEFSTSVFSRP